MIITYLLLVDYIVLTKLNFYFPYINYDRHSYKNNSKNIIQNIFKLSIFSYIINNFIFLF